MRRRSKFLWSRNLEERIMLEVVNIGLYFIFLFLFLFHFYLRVRIEHNVIYHSNGHTIM